MCMQKILKIGPDDNLSGKKLAEYEDIKKCADAFAKIVGNNINTK